MDTPTQPHLILIADDDGAAREQAKTILENAGFRVIQAIDGGSARRFVHEQDVSAAIIDHFMEPHGGLKFAQDIGFDGYELPMLLVTNEETSDLLVEATRAGFSGFLKKPVDPERLVQAVKRMLRMHHGHKDDHFRL